MFTEDELADVEYTDELLFSIEDKARNGYTLVALIDEFDYTDISKETIVEIFLSVLNSNS